MKLGMSAPKTIHVNATVAQSSNSSGVNINNIDLNNKDSVIKVYKLLYPTGVALNNDVLKYKSILEGLLFNKFKIDPRTLF